MSILITGGTGYIGSHCAIQFAKNNRNIILVDNLSNSKAKVVNAIEKILERKIVFIHGDIRNKYLMEQILQQYQCTAVAHFAGLKAVGESVEKPLCYFDNNISGSISLFSAMQQCSVKNMVFSSSATVYGKPKYLPIDENHPLDAVNPYGRSKLHIENMLEDIAKTGNWRIVHLRYFNPAGAHSSGLIGENPQGIPNNLIPYITQTAAGIRTQVNIFGNDYPTKDGTGVRDYIHIEDVATGHVAALAYIEKLPPQERPHCFNLGTGQGYSVKEVIATYTKVSGKDIATRIAPRRSGDVAICYASIEKAQKIFKWQPRLNLTDMCQSAWKWQQQH